MSKKYPDCSLLVKHGDDLPIVGEDHHMTSPITGDNYIIKIKAIHRLKWNFRGDLIIEIDGIKRIVPKGAELP
jgi:hypothetical protein